MLEFHHVTSFAIEPFQTVFHCKVQEATKTGGIIEEFAGWETNSELQ